MKYIIEHGKYGQPGEFDSLQEARAAMLRCGIEFCGTQFRVRWDLDEWDLPEGVIVDEEGDTVGYVEE